MSSRASAPAADVQMAAEVAEILDRRGALKHPPVSLVVSDAVALAIAGVFRSDSISGRVLERLYRTGAADSDELLRAVEVEQAFASPEGHAALHCLAGWVRAQVHRRKDARSADGRRYASAWPRRAHGAPRGVAGGGMYRGEDDRIVAL